MANCLLDSLLIFIMEIAGPLRVDSKKGYEMIRNFHLDKNAPRNTTKKDIIIENGLPGATWLIVLPSKSNIKTAPMKNPIATSKPPPYPAKNASSNIRTLKTKIAHPNTILGEGVFVTFNDAAVAFNALTTLGTKKLLRKKNITAPSRVIKENINPPHTPAYPIYSFINYPAKFLRIASGSSERSNPTLHACLPQKTPSASHGQARCSSNTAITQGEPSPEARRAFPLTQQKLSLDHDHATGEPRGLLHQQCNMKVAQIETHTKKLNYIISRLMLVELALQFRKKHYQLFYAVLSYIEGLLALRCLSWP